MTSTVTADGKLIVAGEFTNVNGVATTGLAALNTDDRRDDLRAGRPA